MTHRSARWGLVALLVRDYDEAVDFFTGALGFALREDIPRGDGQRWVVADPPAATEDRWDLLQLT